jgi:chromosome segregation ATPase
MIESIMYFGGGFLVASLLALVLISFVHQRAVRLTRRRLEDAIPVSMAELQADKDNLRAEFAVSSRRLEITVEQLRAKVTAQLGEIARKAEAVNLLKNELAEKNTNSDELDAKLKALAQKIHETEQELAVKTAALESAERRLGDKEVETTTATDELVAQRLSADAQRVQIAVLQTQIEEHKSQIDELQAEAQDAARRLFDERVNVSSLMKDVEEKRMAIDVLRPQVAQLEGEIVAHTKEIADRGARIVELEGLHGGQVHLVAQRDAEIQSLKDESVSNNNQHDAVAKRLNDEKAALQNLVEAANGTANAYAARISELELLVAGREKLLEERAAEIVGHQQLIAANTDERNTVVQGLNEEKSTLQDLLGTANATIDSHVSRIGELESLVAERDRVVEERDAEVSGLKAESAAKTEAHDAIAHRLNEDKGTLQDLLGTAHATIDSHVSRIGELESLVAERDRLVEQRDAEISGFKEDGASKAAAHNAMAQRLTDEKISLDQLLQHANQTLETRADRIADLERWVAERDEGVRRRDAEIKAAFAEIEALKRDHVTATASLRAEKSDLEIRMRSAAEDQSRSQNEVAALRKEADETWRAERDQNNVLRERISNVAAMVANLARVMDKSGAIETMLTESAAIRPAGIDAGATSDDGSPRAGSLTDRIRKLQNGASRASTAS